MTPNTTCDPNSGKSSAIRRGSSVAADPRIAAAEIYEALRQPNIELAAVFCSSRYDIPALAEALRSCFGAVPLIGCTTAGEIAPDGYQSGGISGFSLASHDFTASVKVFDDLTHFTITEGRSSAQSSLQELEGKGLEPNGDNAFAFLLIDGMCQREELVANALHGSLRDIPLFGGSAGVTPTSAAETKTWIYYNGEFRNDRAALALVHTSRVFEVFKTENFVPTEIKMVITEARPEIRTISEINGLPAAKEYYRLAGVGEDTNIMNVSATHPLGVLLGDQFYLRAVGWAGEDGSIRLLCAIDQGVILTMGAETDFKESLEREFERIRGKIGESELVIACDCFSRLLDVERKGIKEQAGTVMAANNAVGFNTYGEQYYSMHMNQTLTGVAIGKAGSK